MLYDDENASCHLHKRLTTPHDPSRGRLLGLEELLDLRGIAQADVPEIVHGTTLVTNAIIERKGAPVGLITTRGFRDILEMGTEQRYDIYDLFVPSPSRWCSRDRRIEVAERMTRQRQVVTPLDEDAVRPRRKLVAAGCEAMAVCFPACLANPAHEKRAAAIVRAAFPGPRRCRCPARSWPRWANTSAP